MLLLLVVLKLKYVSRIMNRCGFEVQAGSLIKSNPNQGVVPFITDSQTLNTVRFTYGNGMDEIIGISGLLDMAIEHSYKTAKLHKYIESAYTVRASTAAGAGLLKKDAIWTPGKVIYFEGYKGSVCKVVSRDSGYHEFMTLYEVLLELCRIENTCVMSRDTLSLDSDGFTFRSVVKFKHNKEADGFFAKMFMEAMAQDEVCRVSG